MGFSITGRQLFFYGLVIISAGILVGSGSLTFPFGRDQAFYAYSAKLLLNGKLNYQYVFDIRPPGSTFIFSFEQLFMGLSQLNARIFDLIWEILTSIVILFISVKIIKNNFLKIIPSLFYLFLYYRYDYWHTMQADGFLNLPFALCILLLISASEKHSFLRYFLAGIFFGAALIFKYTIIIFLPLAVLSLFYDRKYLFTLKLKNLIVFFSGSLIFIAVILFVYWKFGDINEFINIQFVQTPIYANLAFETESKKLVLDQILRLFLYSVYSPLIFLSFSVFIFYLYKKNFEFGPIIIFAWLISSVVSLIIQWKFYYYHYLVIIPALSICSILLLDTLVIRTEFFKKRFYIIGLILIVFILFASSPYKENFNNIYQFIFKGQNLENSYIKNGTTTDSVFMYEKTLNSVNYITKHTVENDKIYLWGYDPLLYYLSNRYCVSRFLYNVPLLWKAENTKLKNEFLAELKLNKPKFFIVASGDPVFNISGFNEDSYSLLKRFTELNRFLEENYIFKVKIDDYYFFELKNW